MQTPMVIIGLEIESFKCITAKTIDADGKHILIEGPNGSGKTSIIDATTFVLHGLCGANNPVLRGKGKASVTLNVSNGNTDEDLQIERTITKEGKTKLLVYRGQEGEEVKKSPQGVIDLLFNKHFLNPTEFLNLKPADQTEFILGCSTVELPADRVHEICGLQILAKEGETAVKYMARVEKTFYDDRADKNKDANQKSKALADFRETMMRSIEMHVDVQAVNDKFEALQREAAERNEATAALELAKSALSASGGDIMHFEHSIQKAEDVILVAAKQTIEAEKAIAYARSKIRERQECVEDAKAAVDQAAIRFAKTRNVQNELYECRTEMMHAVAANERLKAQQESLIKLTAEKKDYESAAVNANGVLENIRLLSKELIKDMDLGVPGLEIVEERPYLHGVPLEDASKAQQLIAACKLSKKRYPLMGIVRLDEGERLDKQSKEILINWADENKCQLVMTSVSNADFKVEIV